MPAIELSAEVRQDGRARGDAQRNRAGFAVTAYRPLPWCSGGVSRPTCQQLHHYLRQRYRRKVIRGWPGSSVRKGLKLSLVVSLAINDHFLTTRTYYTY